MMPVAPPEGGRRITVIQGEQHVTADSDVVLSTLLGSCVAACLRDPLAGIGGMNHFLLPGRDRADTDTAVRYGVHAMELLVNELLARGASRSRLQAKLFGGGRMTRGLTDIGALNAGFAERFLRDEGIAWVGGSMGGEQGRRVQFWPVSGRARQMLMAPQDASAFHVERPPAAPPQTGSVELF